MKVKALFLPTFAVSLLVLLLVGCAHAPVGGRASIVPPEEFGLTSPANRLVFQRDLHGNATIPIAGKSSWPGGIVEARLSLVDSTNKEGSWRRIGTTLQDGSFSTELPATNGWYGLEVRVREGRIVSAPASVERVGVGEVFVIVGHSVAQGGSTNLSGASDDRVNTVAWPNEASSTRREYERTGKSRWLPPLVGVKYGDGVQPAPFGNGPYFWAQFAERIARTQGVPVLIFNAAFGGTSLEHWAKSARGEAFEHSFVKSALRMPYINLHHALREYALVTGVRAVLADQGQNDWPEPDSNKVFQNYKTWVDQARLDLGFPNLAIVVNRQTPPGGKSQIRRAQERMVQECPHCWPGADYDHLLPVDRYDGIHLSEPGMRHAAALWADALDASFFRKVEPYQPR